MKRTAAELASLSELLDQALELPVEERATWIERLDAANDTLKPTLRKMLLETADAAAGGMTSVRKSVDAAVLGAAASAESLALTAGASIGPYELIREIGRGGMGAVWLARRAEGLTRRLVALKLPHPGLFHAELAQRIGRERDILEGLAHPNIARLYDAGVSPAGQPYLALEYVEGTPIADYCNAKQLNTRERIALIQQLLDAMQYAHAQLVIHRDLKPANILVTDSGRAMLLDFGIAKLLSDDGVEETALTRLGGRALTPDYASPEQIAGRPLGTASDVYSLGVVMYELLSGQRPYSLSKALSIEQAFQQIVIARPSSMAADAGARRALEGDLDTIVLKALKIAPSERYATVAAIADDLDRHLRGDPVLAQPDSLWYRTRKFTGRNKLAVGAVGAVIAALAVGMTVALWQARAAQSQANRAEQVKKFVLSLFRNADTDAGAEVTTTAADLLRAAHARIAAELQDQPGVRAELLDSIAFSLIGQGSYEDAEKVALEAMQTSSSVYGFTDPRTISARATYGESLYRRDRIDDAVRVLRAVIEDAKQKGLDEIHVNALQILGSAQIDLGDIDAAIATTRLAVDIVETRPSSVSTPLAADAYGSYANVLYTAHRSGQAAAARECLRLVRSLGANASRPKLLFARLYLARSLVDEGETKEGLREFDGLLPAMEKVLGSRHPEVSIAENYLGLALLTGGDVDGSIDAFSRSLVALLEKPGAPDWNDLGNSSHALGTSYAAADRPAAAVVLFTDAIAQWSARAETSNPLLLRVRSRRALAYAQLGELKKAEREFSALEGAPFSELDKALHDGRLARFRSLQGRHEEAVALARASVAALANNPSEAGRAGTLAVLGLVLAAAGQYSSAIEPLQQAHDFYRRTQIKVTPDHARVLAALGRSRAALGDRLGALQALSEAEQFWRAYAPQNASALETFRYMAELRTM